MGREEKRSMGAGAKNLACDFPCGNQYCEISLFRSPYIKALIIETAKLYHDNTFQNFSQELQ